MLNRKRLTPGAALAFVVALLAVSASGIAAPFDPVAAKPRLIASAKSANILTNGILTVEFDSYSGRFTIRTGANHPHPNQTVLYPVGTSYITLRDATSQEMFVNCTGSNAGLAGYTLATMCPTAPTITALEGTGFRATYTLANWIVVQEVQINGLTIDDTNVRQSVTVTNTTGHTRRYGVRYMWDWMIAGNDASFFRQRNPDAQFTGMFTTFPNPTFQLFEEVNNISEPTFSIYATVGGGALVPAPTTPDQIRYSSWGSLYSYAWDFSNGGGFSDSGTAHYWGYNSPLSLQAGASATFVEYVTTQLAAVTPPTADVTVSSSTLAFGDVAVGSSSATQSATITSTGTVPYQVSGFGSTSLCQAGAFCVGGAFTCSTDCAVAPASYGAGSSCHVSASFNPTETGPRSASIYICDNATGSPRSIALSGNGVPAAQVLVSPASNDFGSVLAGSRSAPVTFTLFNSASSSVALGNPATTGDFLIQSTTCGTVLGPGASCSATVVFAPSQPGRADGRLLVPSSAGAALSGTGFLEARVSLPSQVDLGNYTIGAAALSQAVQLRNVGNAVLSLASVSVSEGFTLQNACPLNLAPDESCNLVIGFSATHAGDFTGALTVVSNAPGALVSVPLAARAQLRPVPILRLAPIFIGFGERLMGSTGPSVRVTVTNDGGAAAVLTNIATSVDFVVVGSTCGATLAPQASCGIDVALRATTVGRLSGQLLISSNAQGSPISVDLQGTGCLPLAFGGNRGAGRTSCGS